MRYRLSIIPLYIFSTIVFVIAAVGSASAAQQAVWYNSPSKLYGIAIPPNAKAQQLSNNTLMVRSQNGYTVRLQTGAVNSKIDLNAMAAKLESIYLGEDKTWRAKLAHTATSVSGLDAIAMIYDGSKVRSKAIIARGAKDDFVFIFTAPSETFNKQVRYFDWMLANFRPAASEVKVSRAEKRPNKSPERLSTTLDDISHFADHSFGYSVAYPGNWSVTRLSPAALLISGKEGTQAYYATVGIQNIQPPSATGPQHAMAAVLADLKTELSAKARDVRYFDEGAVNYEKQGLRLKAHQFVVTYEDDGQLYKQWTMVIPRPTGTVIHVWSYRSPEKQFDIFRPIADAIRQSWRIDIASAESQIH
jgi:hypothetical protein